MGRGGVPRRARERGSGGDTAGRVLTALPAIAFAIFIVAEGGLVFALGAIALGCVALQELYGMMQRARPVNLAGLLAVVAMGLAALYGTKGQVLLMLVLAVPVTFVLTLVRPARANVSWGMAATLFGVVWIGVAIAHAIFLRELDHGGALVLDTLIAVFIGDTCAYSELVFSEKLWPDFDRDELAAALDEFEARERRFGAR